MNNAIRYYGRLLQPWLTVAVYLWVLQLIADFSIDDPEPLLDRIADCAAILWTLIFWMVSVVLVIFLLTIFFTRTSALILNELGAKVAVILITALFFARWLFNWSALLGNSDLVLYVLATICLVMSAWVWYRRKNQSQQLSSVFSFNDGWYYLAMPFLIASAFILSYKITAGVSVLKASRLQIGRALVATSPDGRRPQPNVVLIVADALRAQSMSLYGYRRKTTPFLDSFAERSSVYTQMYSNSTSTRTSLTSILSGKYPLSHGRLTKFLPPYDSVENLVSLLRDNGYTTAAVSSNSDATFYALGLTKYLVYGEYPNFRRLALSWLRDNGVYPTNSGNRMYDELASFFPFLGFPDKTLGYGRAEDTLDRALRLVMELPEPFFLFVHVHEPHNPYEAPAPFRGRYARLDDREVMKKISSDYYGRYQPDLQPFVDQYRDHYDETIQYLDTELAKFVRSIEQTRKFNNLFLLLTADHGESFERGFLNHGEDLYESSLHVPLVVKFPNQQAGQRLSMPLQSVDLAPTILHAIDVAIPTWMDGVPITLRQNLESRERVMINFKDPLNRKVYDRPTKLAIRWLQYKLIASCDSKQLELFDVANDPGEQNNLAGVNARLAKDLWERLEGYLANQSNHHGLECDRKAGT